MLHLRVVEGFLQRIDWPTRHPRVVQDFDPGSGRLRARHLLDVNVQRLTVRDPARRGGVLWPLQQLRGPERAAELAPHGPRGSDGNVAVLGAKHPHRRIGWVLLPTWAGKSRAMVQRAAWKSSKK